VLWLNITAAAKMPVTFGQNSWANEATARTTIPAVHHCLECGADLRLDLPPGLCPKCLFSLGLPQEENARAVSAQDLECVLQAAASPLGVKFHSFGDYELIEEIGRGGMGVVFRANQVCLRRVVALKLIRAGALATAELVQRFKSEAEAAASLTHSHIVPIYEIGEHQGHHYFSMGLIEGRSLRQRLAGKPMDICEAVRLLVIVAHAVHFAHQHGILHVDITSGNILLDGNGQPHLSDFGLARLSQKDATLSQTNAVFGTPAYMAPEMARGDTKGVTAATDVYGLGAVLYETLTGAPPFRGSTAMGTVQQVLHQQPHRPSLLNPAVAPDLEAICLRCLEKNAKQRYSSAEALAEDLERWLRQETRAEMLRLDLYVSDLGLAYQAWESGRASRTRELLEEKIPKRGKEDLRGFEWRYLWGISRPREIHTFQGRWAGIWGSAWSPDGRWLAAGNDDGEVHLWELEVRGEGAVLKSGTSLVYAVAFSPDGRILAATALDEAGEAAGAIHLWDMGSRQLSGVLVGHTRGVVSVRFSPDGRWLASMAGSPYMANQPCEIFLWDAASRQKRAEFKRDHSLVGLQCSFSPDGTRLATPHGDGSIVLWDLPSNQIAAMLTGHRGVVVCVDYSPDGRSLASGGIDGTVRLWDAEGRRLEDVVGTHAGPVYAVKFSPDGRRLASASMDHTAKLWDLVEGGELTTFRGHAGRVFSVSFSPDGRQVATGSHDGTVKLWTAPTKADLNVLDRHSGMYASVGFSPGGQWLAQHSQIHGKPMLTLWRAATKAKVSSIPAACSGFSPGHELLACAGPGLDLWDLSADVPRHHRTIGGPTHLNNRLLFSADGKWMVIRQGLDKVIIWDASTWQATAWIQEGTPPRSIHSYAFSADGRLLATGYDHDVRLWRFHEQRWVKDRLLSGHKGEILDLTFAAHDQCLVTAGRDTTVKLWNVMAGALMGELHGDGGAARCLAFTADGKTLAVGSQDGLVTFWNVARWREIASLKAHQTIVWDLAFSPDDKTLVTISFDETLRLWPAPAFAEIDRSEIGIPSS
jgi:WD40 repeat protein/tRNA A-37 threonylcarbamoyl transferase component Bud32